MQNTDTELDYLRRKWREDVTDPATGVGLDELKRLAAELVAARKDAVPWCRVKAELFALVCDRMSVGVSAHDDFPACACYSRKNRVLTKIINGRIAEVDAKYAPEAVKAANAFSGFILRHDYDHATPDWDAALALGFTGLRDRVAAIGRRNDFQEAMLVVAEAMLRTVRRMADVARASKDAESPRVKRLVAALDRLAKGPPRTFHEALTFQLLFFVFGEHVDHLQVRTLGNWDRLMTPYYEADLAAGRLTREGAKDLVRHFWWQWGSIDNWWGQPVYLGGTKADGTTEYNDFSRLVLEVHDELALPTPKLQLKIAANTPKDILPTALDMVRRQRSIVFCGEEPMARAMAAMGFTAEDARVAELWGCYEFQPRARANTTLPCVVNPVQVVQTLLARARKGELAAPTFADFRAEFDRLFGEWIDRSLEIVRAFEAHMDEFIPGLVHSLSIESCVTRGQNAVGSGMEHNLAVILQCGLGTAVDSLAAIEEIVYARRLMTLGELGAVMAANWKGHDELRLRMRASRRKWGNNDPFTNALARDLLAVFGKRVNGKPNSRGGKFFASGHSIDYFTIIGRWSGPSPDGRLRGEEYSKNLSPSPGADREGPTALIASFRALDVSQIPGDVILDMMIHPSLVHGDRGLMAMEALVWEYFAAGGCALNFNVISAEKLRDAQAHPERYENLQIRVCGWNVRWNDLTREQQDGYIRRAECIMQ